MTVLSRTANAERRRLTPFRSRERAIAESTPHPRLLDPEVRVGRLGARERGDRPARLESDLDETTYNCGCGYVFQAPVVTSVDCPHCGDSQAW